MELKAMISKLQAAAERIFSNQKAFSDPIIGSLPLNKAGLHIARMIVSDLCNLLRTLPFFWLHPVLWFRLQSQGVLIIENFLDKDEWNALVSEYEKVLSSHEKQYPVLPAEKMGFGRKISNGDGFDRYDGGTLNRFISIKKEHATLTSAFSQSRKLSTLTLALFGLINRSNKHYIYKLIHGDESLNPDIQKDIHKDTFHHTFKIWFFIDDVELSGGPLEYSLGSHKSTLRRMGWEYSTSLIKSSSDCQDKGGAFRIEQNALKELGFSALSPLAVRSNTLVIADTKGFHRRGMAECGKIRRGFYANFRPQAFLPFLH